MRHLEDDYAPWVGRVDEMRHDHLTPSTIARFEATFAPILKDCAALHLGLHWCLCPPTFHEDGLGLDGHATKGGFLPPVPLPRRMWAGGEITFLGQFCPGDEVKKKSQIIEVTPKNGRSGPLVFVTVAHGFFVGETEVLRERHHIVYRPVATQMTPLPAPNPHRPRFFHETPFAISPVTLFRYSALTFNSHRIHYDLDYVRAQEFYPDLVIHGPLQATALLNIAAQQQSKPLQHFTYRGVAPAIGPQVLTLGADRLKDDTCTLSVLNAAGHDTMKAVAHW